MVLHAGASERNALVTRFGVFNQYKLLIWVYDLVTCSCAPRPGGTRTAPPSATCSWSTTSGTRPPRPRRCGCCTTSAARTRSTRPRSSGWPGRCAACWTRAGRRRCGEPGLAYAGSVAFGGPWLLDQLWQRLGIGAILTARLGKTRRDAAAERVLFALVANRALDPSSKLAAAHWVGRKAWIDRLPETTDDACYRAMDWLHQVQDAVEKEIFGQVANLLNLEVDLLFFDTTSTYFEVDEEDEPVPRDKNGNATDDEQKAAEGKPAGFRAYGKSKDHRDDLPQVVIGMAVTRDGIPVRVWCWPGNTDDSALIRQVKDDMRDWTLSKIVWVADRGFTSAENRRYLRKGDHHYIIGEKLRSGSAEAGAALSRQGRYQDVAANLRVKEVRISESERFVICFNPEAPSATPRSGPGCSPSSTR